MRDHRQIYPEDITTQPGAYQLLIALDQPCAIFRSGRQTVTLPPGLYAYCGSAYGPGGLRARIARHLKQDKKVRWHVDQITTRGTVIAVQTHPDGNECILLQELLHQPGVTAPLPGFGSSDCGTCIAHFLSLPAGFGPAR